VLVDVLEVELDVLDVDVDDVEVLVLELDVDEVEVLVNCAYFQVELT